MEFSVLQGFAVNLFIASYPTFVLYLSIFFSCIHVVYIFLSLNIYIYIYIYICIYMYIYVSRRRLSSLVVFICFVFRDLQGVLSHQMKQHVIEGSRCFPLVSAVGEEKVSNNQQHKAFFYKKINRKRYIHPIWQDYSNEIIYISICIYIYIHFSRIDLFASARRFHIRC